MESGDASFATDDPDSGVQLDLYTVIYGSTIGFVFEQSKQRKKQLGVSGTVCAAVCSDSHWKPVCVV